MKAVKFWMGWSIIVLFSLALASAAAAATLTLNTTAGPPTTALTITGAAFGLEEAVDVYFDTTDLCLAVTDDVNGNFVATLKVPKTAEPGVHWITALGRASNKAKQTAFTVRTDWAQYRRVAAHTGANPFENVLNAANLDQLNLAWTATTTGLKVSPPALASGWVYVGADDKKLYCFNAATGARIRGYPVTLSNAIPGSPAVANGFVYAATSDGKLYAYGYSLSRPVLKTGFPVSTGGPITSSPVVAGSRVYVGTNSPDNKLYAFDASTGVKLWDSGILIASGISYSPVVAGGVVYVGTQEGQLYAFNAASGAPIAGWPVSTGSTPICSPAVANGLVYMVSSTKIFAFKTATATPQPGFPVICPYHPVCGPALANGWIYVRSEDIGSGQLLAFNAATGVPKAGFPVILSEDFGLSRPTSSPVVANGVVYCSSMDQNLYAVHGASGALLSFVAPGVASNNATMPSEPVVADGKIYINSNDGHLSCLDLDSGLSAMAATAGKKGVPRPDPASLVPDYSLPLPE